MVKGVSPKNPMSCVDSNSSNDEKVKLFRSLFCGRGDVFARRFDNAKTGKKGYSPCCENQWVRGVCGLLRGMKCAECPNRNMLSVSDALLQHTGIRVIRFLIEDVCERLDSVLGEIVAF